MQLVAQVQVAKMVAFAVELAATWEVLAQMVWVLLVELAFLVKAVAVVMDAVLEAVVARAVALAQVVEPSRGEVVVLQVLSAQLLASNGAQWPFGALEDEEVLLSRRGVLCRKRLS